MKKISFYRGGSLTSLSGAEIKMKISQCTLWSLFASLLVFFSFTTQSASANYVPSSGITFSGNGNYLSMSSGFQMSSELTAEGWVRSTDWSKDNALVLIGAGSGSSCNTMSIRSTATNEWSIDESCVTRANFRLSTTMPSNTWIHIAVVKDSNGMGMWINGTPLSYVNGSCGSCDVTSNIPKFRTALSGTSTAIGAWWGNNWYSQGGTIGELRLSNTARVASNAGTYSVPTSTMSSDSNTVLLLKAPSSGSTFTDSKTNPQTLTTNGTVTSSTYLQSQSIAFPTTSYALAYGSTQQLSVTGTSGSGAVTYNAGTSTACSVNTNTGVVSVTASTGTCSLSATIAADSAYNSATTATPVTITVSKATSTIVATGSTAFTYTGSPQGPSDATVTGSTGSVTYAYSGSGTTSFGPSATKPINAGSYSVTATVAASGNYATATSASYAFNIAQAAQATSLVITSTIATLETNLTLQTSGGNGGGGNSFNVNSGPCTVSGSTLSATAAGTCMVTATKAAEGNYLAASSSSTAITINKATPTFSNFPNLSKTYGARAFDLSSPTSSTPGTWSFSSGTTSVISINGISATVVSAGTSVITATFAPTYTDNYVSGGTTTMTVTVGKAALSITASSHTVAYGGAIPAITPTISGFVNGEDASVVTGISCSTTYTTTTSVGTTGSSCTGATASNYSFAYTSGVITVTQGGQTTPLVISSNSVTYGSTLSLVTTGGDGSGSNTFVVDSGPCTVSTATLSASAAGTCMVTATKAANGNFLAASSTSTAITVNPKGLTISGLTGVNKEFDGGLSGSVTGTPSLVGVVNSDNVLLSGTPTFAFASANVANGITVTASGYALTGTTAGNYTLTQPTVTANITAKAARVAATNTTVAFGAAVTSGFTTSGLISPDVVGSASYTYTGTGTATPPTAVGVYTVTPSNAIFSTGLTGNYSITYDTATVTILAKYTITYNANGGSVSNGSTATIDFVVGDTALTLPTPTRPNYTFTGWYTLQTNGVQVTGAYTPSATATLWARWIQNSLYGMGSNTKILTITTLSGVGNTYSANAGGGTIAIEYLADALPAGTVIDAYVLSDTSTATSLIGAGNDYVMSLVLAWVATDETVPTTATGKPITMTITNSSIKRGAKIYSVIGVTPTLLTTATTDGSAVISITDDPQIIIAITKPDAPTGVSATSGGNASTTVSWTAPSDGGSVITGYTATSNAGQTCSSTTTSCSITGLTNGTSYTFTVTATNSIGVSDPSSASSPITPAAPVVTPPSSGGGGGGSTYVAPTPEPTPTVDPAVAAAAAAKALADAKAAEEKAAADAKALAEKRAAEEAELLAQIKALQEKADAESLAAAKKLQEELAATQLKAEEELKAAAALKVAEEQRAAAAKKITTVYSTTAAFKLNTTYSKRLTSYSKKIAAGSTVTCIGYAKSSKTLSYSKAKTVATKQAKALCASMKKINPTLVTKSTVLPASKAPVTTVNKKWIPVSYRVQAPVN